MKLSITAWCVQKKLFGGSMTLKDFIDFAAENGVEAVELLDCFWQDFTPEEIRRYLDEKQMRCVCYSVINNFLRADSTVEQEIAKVKAGVDLAPTLGTDMVRVFSSRPNPAYTKEETMKVIVNSLKECADYAKAHGVTLVLENHGAFAGSSKQAMQIISDVGSDALFINADTGNFLVGLEEPLHGVDAVYDKLRYLHIKDVVYAQAGEPTMDGRFLEGVVVGEGIANIPGIVSALKERGYTGYLSVEYEGIDRDCCEGTIQCIDKMKQLLHN